MKKFGIVLLVMVIIVAGVVYMFRHEIFQYSAEKIIRSNLPSYVSVKSIVFDLKEGVMEVTGFGVKNPRGYNKRFLAEIGKITCRYQMKGEHILDGIEVTEIVADKPLINIERLPDGRINVNDMGDVMKSDEPAKAVTTKKEKPRAKKPAEGGRNISDYVKLTDTIKIRGGKVVFTDGVVSTRPYVLTFEDMNGNLVLGLSKDYTNVNRVATQGSGIVNGDSSQQVKWNISLDPRSAQLNMANRYNLKNVDIRPFKPYYDEYSPIIIEGGRMSGTLIFEFSDGNIGSNNTVRLRNFRFKEKTGGAGSQYWQVGITDVIKYLQSSSGEIVFDFKIKGSMKSPSFYPGPQVMQAIQSAVVDKIADAFTTKEEGQGGQTGGGDKSDAEKVVDVLRGLLNE